MGCLDSASLQLHANCYTGQSKLLKGVTESVSNCFSCCVRAAVYSFEEAVWTA